MTLTLTIPGRLLAALFVLSIYPAHAGDGPATHLDAGHFRTYDCDRGPASTEIECGAVKVHEDPEGQGSRTIEIHYLRIAGTREGPALFVFGGGPGEHTIATSADDAIGKEFGATREVVVFDQRGAGRSNGLDCVNEATTASAKGFRALLKKGLFHPDFYRDCLKKIRSRANPALYTTTAIAHDAETLRRKLGYDRIDIYGHSYGTTAALEYLRRYPKSVRAAVLAGPIPPSVIQVKSLADNLDAALSRLFRDCAADQTCHRAFPNPAGDLGRLVQRLAEDPPTIEIRNPISGTVEHVALSRDLAVTAIRYSLYSVNDAARIPYGIDKAVQGDYGPLTQALGQLAYGLPSIVSEGLWASVRCSEEAPYVDFNALVRDAKSRNLGSRRIEHERVICDFWPKGRIPADFHEPVRADVPVLLVVGELDHATPPWMAKRAARTLPNARLVIIPNRSHWGLSDDACTRPIVRGFLDSPSAPLGTGCAQKIKRPPFVVDGTAID